MKKSQQFATAVSRIRYGALPPKTVRWGSMSYGGIPLLVGINDDDEVCRISFTTRESRAAMLAAWGKKWPATRYKQDDKAIAPVAAKMLKGLPVAVQAVGTEFQREIWKNLLRIPAGKVLTYAELARRSKNAKAVRAAGTACGSNPIAILIPCHRVIASDGTLGGFGGGLPAKKKLLKAEGFQEFVQE